MPEVPVTDVDLPDVPSHEPQRETGEVTKDIFPQFPPVNLKLLFYIIEDLGF